MKKNILSLAVVALCTTLQARFELPDGFSRPGERNKVGEVALATASDTALKDMAEQVIKKLPDESWIRKTIKYQNNKLTPAHAFLDQAAEEFTLLIEPLDLLPRMGIDMSAAGVELAMQAAGSDAKTKTKLAEAADKWLAARAEYEGIRAGLIQDLAQYDK